ncbi:MAG: hypothetical protein QOJ11_509 [Frankiales bacterium]|jgi:signal transduction histidine kinase|nr:hypothetical protein [Frankiales bacterium]
MGRAREWRGRLAAVPHGRAGVAALLALLAVVETLLRATNDSPWYVLVLSLLALSTTLPLAVLPPAPAAAAVTAASVLSLAPFHSLTVAGGAVQLVVLYRLGSQLMAAALALPFLVLALTVHAQADTAVVLASLAMAAAWAGAAQRARREAAAHSAARKDIVSTVLEHSAQGERARIARELHDIVAHHISMIAVQAETARLTTAGMPPAGAQRLSSIGDMARAALAEMRLLLGVLREDVESADRQPQPGLRQLNDLLDEARAASGAGTRLIIRGPADPLDPSVELAAYRIVQEALTNARRHAPGAAVDVELYYAADAVRVRIRDNGPGCPDASSGGHGLRGMRERAAAVGGRLQTGPAPGGGFLVETVLPVKPEPAG